MRSAALVVGALAAGCIGGSAWLGLETLRFVRGDGYAPDSVHMPGYEAGAVVADGWGIFLPAGLLFVLGLFLARFAWNLWQGRRR
jgi:hypothetical protein